MELLDSVYNEPKELLCWGEYKTVYLIMCYGKETTWTDFIYTSLEKAYERYLFLSRSVSSSTTEYRIVQKYLFT